MSDSPASSDPIAEVLSSIVGPIWLQVGKVFAGTDTRVINDAHIVYDADGIRHVGVDLPPRDVIRMGQEKPDLLLPQHVLLPGLTDAHTHLFLEGGETDTEKRSAHLKLSPDDQLDLAQQRLRRLVAIGITAVREAGDKAGVGLALQGRYRSPHRGIMPYVDAPGAAINHQKRYGSFMARPMEEYGSPEATVEARIADGAHRIKLLATGIINFEKGAVTAKPQMPVEELSTFVNASRDRGKHTMVHCSGNDGVDNCIAARVDTVEHGYFIDDDQLSRIRDADTVWVPTFAPVQFQIDEPEHIGWSEQVCTNLQRIIDGHSRSLVKAQELGVRIVAGSDAGSHGVPHGWGFLRELELMQSAGLTATQVLATATGAGRKRMGYAESFGALLPGYKSRFLLTTHDVLQDVAQLRRPKTVVFDGHVITSGDHESQPGL
ncbi:MAG: amidohydrolase family protein [Synoicihabitans sp.]